VIDGANWRAEQDQQVRLQNAQMAALAFHKPQRLAEIGRPKRLSRADLAEYRQRAAYLQEKLRERHAQRA
jgi:hypothetical protein